MFTRTKLLYSFFSLFRKTPTPFYQADSATNTGRTSLHTTAVLPNPQPFADLNAEVAARLYIVYQPRDPPKHVLKDVFSRFADLIDVSTFQNDIAHARFSSKISADAAIADLDKQEILGIKVSVFYAEAPLKDTEKRLAKSLWSIYYIFSFFLFFFKSLSLSHEPACKSKSKTC